MDRQDSRLGEGGPPTPGRAAPRATVRRLAVSKLGQATLGLLAIAIIVVLAGSSMSRTLMGWLHGRPAHRLDFSEIELAPPPPAWLRGGRASFLAAIEEARASSGPIAMPDLDLGALLLDFRRSPWVARADRASKGFPNRVVVELAYREPVAWLQADAESYAIDEEGVVLPINEVDPAHASKLVKILARRPVGDPKPGLAWPDEGRISTAAALASFLRRKAADPPEVAARLAPGSIDATTENLFLRTADGGLILWRLPPGRDEAAGINDRTKWERVVGRVEDRGGLDVRPEVEYLRFTRDGVATGRFKP